MLEDEVNKFYLEYKRNYFEKYFSGKNINLAICEISENIILKLTKFHIETGAIIELLCAIRSNKEYFNKLDNESKRNIKTGIISFKIINKNINKILLPIIEGFKE